MGFIDEIKAKAKTCKQTIVLPETEDIRTYEAAEAVLKEGTANLILVGSEEEIAKNADRGPGDQSEDRRVYRKACGAAPEEGNDRRAG